MKRNGQKELYRGLGLLGCFGVWTWLVQTVDVQAAGPAGEAVGFAGLNGWFHGLTRVHWTLYTLTDWLGLVPVAVCLWFAGLGLGQWIRRRYLGKVDFDILLLGLYYGSVILMYLLFEAVPVNYRPVLIQGRLEASYPSSTTLLALSVMPTAIFQGNRRLNGAGSRRVLGLAATGFSLFLVLGRLLSGVHWLTDIVGAALLSGGAFQLYKGAVALGERNRP